MNPALAKAETAVEGPVVETSSGKLRGATQAGIHSFKGVPYGESTAGTARWLPARPAAWSGVRDALEYGPRAPQNERPSQEPHLKWIRDTRPFGEDCLVLNVWTPGVNDNAKRPVMVYVHGGGFIAGASSAVGIDGTNLARRGDVVVISLNHRLNLFGFLHLGDAEGGRYLDAGNVGMLDVVTALRWVRDNAAVFGGDAGNVTVFGQSGGASKVALLAAMPESKGLIHKGIIQSASSMLRMGDVEAVTRNTKLFMEQAGAGDVAALREIPMDRLLAAMRATITAAGRVDEFRPVVDGRALPTQPFHPSALAMSARVPLLMGNCETEAAFAFSQEPSNFALTEEQVQARVARFVGCTAAEATDLIALYRKTRPGMSPGQIFTRIHSDHMYWRSVTRAAELKSAHGGAPAYVYQMTWKTPVLDGILGTPHTICLPFVFGNVDVAAGLTGNGPERYSLQDRMMGAWIAFARTGNPNHGGLPQWKPYNANERPSMVFDNECKMVNDLRRDERLAFESLPAYVMEAIGRR
jgi:para-nitrobenzyl esterase